MKVVYLLGAAVLAGVGSMSAQGKIDARGQQLLDLYKAGELTLRDSNSFIAVPAGRSGEALASVLVEATDDAVLDSLDACGYDIEYISPSFSIVTMPVGVIETLAKSPAVATLSFGHEATVSMDKARGKSNVNTCHNGIGMAHGFKGEGVIVGMYDTGFDPSHVNFLSQDGRETRLKYYARFQGNGGNPTIYQGNDIRKAPTDDNNETHGTHVAGIMGGAYNGAGTYPSGSNNTKVNLYGVAPEADLAIAAGPLYDNNILSGIRRLINYANSQKKPLVVNLSLGSNNGRHDGTDAFSRTLDELGLEAIICVAAGNEGGDNIHAGKTFTAADKELKTLFQTVDGAKMRRGTYDVWSSNEKEIKVSLIVVKANSNEIIAKISSENGRTITCGSGDGDAHSIFRNAFDGSVTLTATQSGGRYNVAVSASSNITNKSGNTDVLGLMIEGDEGTRVDAYGNGNARLQFSVAVPAGFDRGDNNGSINGMGCGKNIIVVGAYSTRANWINLSGRQVSTGGGDGNLSTFSSWGELVDGRKLPHICAPGTGINSSVSGPYVANNSDYAYSLAASASEGGTTHYWANMNGTSMATPYVTGVVALWLQADPTLTVGKVRSIMMETAKKDDFVTNDIAWGAGKLHASDGIKRVISEAASVSDVNVADNEIIVTANGLVLNAFAGGVSNIAARLYSTSGVLVASASATGENLDIEAPAPGLYVLNVKAGSTDKSIKIVVR